MESSKKSQLVLTITLSFVCMSMSAQRPCYIGFERALELCSLATEGTQEHAPT